VASFNIATSESYKNKEGERVENTEWHRIELWEGLAGVAEQYLKKGDSVYIEGRIKSERYTDNAGIEKTSYKIRGNVMQMLGKRENNSNSSNQGVPVAVQTESEDGLPF
jgi:single-strand DNA-binding protein